MIIDVHVHVFPAAIKADRSDWVHRDPTFAELYASPMARIATSDDLLRSMDTAGVEVSVMQGFAWSDAGDGRRHNDALLEAADRHPDRLVAFCTLNPAGPEGAAHAEARRCLAGGARGFGELRPDAQGWQADPDRLHGIAGAAPLLVHASEPVGHLYPGKGGMHPAALLALVKRFPSTTWILAHLGGGLPFYASMPEIRAAVANTYIDTAAWPLLYRPEVFLGLAAVFGTERILFGSDYPLQAQGRSLDRLRRLPLSEPEIEAILGGNAAALLGLAHGQ